MNRLIFGHETRDLKLVLFNVLLFSLLLNLPIYQVYFRENTLNNLGDWVQFFAFFLFVSFFLLAFYSLFNFKFLQKLAYIAFVLIGSLALYFNLQFKTLFDHSMLLNVEQTHFGEAIEFLTPKLIGYFLLAGCLPAYIIYRFPVHYPKLYQSLIRNIVLFSSSIVLALLSVYPFYGELAGFFRANDDELKYSILPVAPVRAIAKVLTPSLESNQAKQLLDPNASHKINNDIEKPTLIVFVIGETARAKGFFDDPLDPQFRQFMQANTETLIGLQNVQACATSTAYSLPCMFSILSREDFSVSKAKQTENLVELAARTGYQVKWFDNNGGCKGVCNQVDYVDLKKDNPYSKQSPSLPFDEGLIETLKYELSLSAAESTSDLKNRLIVMHQLGSHGPAYHERTPQAFKKHLPECESNDFSGCDTEQVLNSYNNTLIYTKYVISQLIETLNQQNDQFHTMLFYISDHGESVGEDGYFLHGMPYMIAPAEQTQVPALLWMSKGFQSSLALDFQCVRTRMNQQPSHDNISHSMIDFLSIESKAKNAEKSWITGCQENQSD